MKSFRFLFSNNDGYTLILVLLMITLFMLFGLTFMAQSLNTTKQTNVIESKMQATDLAEMGAEYYSYVIKEEIDTIKMELQDWVKDSLIPSIPKEQMKNYKQEDLELILTEKTIDEAEKRISNHSFALNNKNIEPEEDLTFGLKELDYDDKNKRIIYHVEGNSVGNTATILSFIYLDFEQIHVNTEGEIGWIDTIAPDKAFNNCDSKKTIFKNVNCKYNGRLFTNNEKPEFEKSNIKINGNLTLPNINNSDLYNSNFYVTGDFYNTNNLNGTKNFNLYIQGSAEIGNMNNAKNVKICVSHLKKYGGTNNKGDITIYAQVNDSGDSSVIVDPVEFEKTCNFENSGYSMSFQWKVPILKKEFNYN